MHSLFLARDHHLCIHRGDVGGAKSVLASTSLGKATGQQLIPLPWPFALLCWNTHMHLWLSANTATSEDNNRSGRHQQSTKTNKPIFFPLLAWIV
jgi:hypothetical protein